MPSQKPVALQLAAPWSVQVPVGSVPPAATLEQVPRLALRAHDMQVPVQVVAQQIPCAQKVDWHSAPAEQTAPFGLRPQEPLMQEAGEAQSALPAQVALQALVPQVNGKQEVEVGTTQVPAPSQLPPPVKVVPPAGQLAPWQEVPWAYFSQAPAWHLPSVPQLGPPLSMQLPAGSGPEATAAHWPMLPLMAHDWQAPVQALAQQTPCAQKVDWHSTLLEQKAPIGLRPQELPVQTLPGEQAVLSAQTVKQRVPLQTYGLQARASGAVQLPVALHTEAGV